MNKRVLSIEQMKHLQSVGVDTSKAGVFWCVVDQKGCDPFLMLTDKVERLDLIPTFTLQDMLDILPCEVEGFDFNINMARHLVGYDGVRSIVYCDNINLIDVVYEILCWLAENEHLNNKNDYEQKI